VGCSPAADPTGSSGTSADDAISAYVACLAEAGWSAKVEGEGEVVSSYASEQEEAFSADSARCREETGAFRKAQPESDGQWQRAYDQYLAFGECLEDADIDVAPAVSLQVYRESRLGTYSPVDIRAGETVPGFADIYDSCYEQTTP
jgi:hypothetical protein